MRLHELGLLLAAVTAQAGEYAVLNNGFRLRAERHEIVGSEVRLFTGAGAIVLPAESVVAFERDEDAESPAPSLAPPPAAASPTELIDLAAERYGLPRELLHSVAAAESGYRQDAVSRKGAIGIMQLMPATAAELNADPADAKQNVDAGARLLRRLLLKYDGGLYRALAAYNAGPGAVNKYGWIPPYRETQLYVQQVVARCRQLSRGRSCAAD